jgi:single-stranded-DNA-specific exonuclease
MAAGLSLPTERIEDFKEAINKSAASLPESAFVPKDDVMGILRADAIDFELLEILERFEPYGEANSRPKFLAKDAEVISVRRFGADNAHSRLTLRLHPKDRITHEFILFRRVLDKERSPKITCSYSVAKNEYNSRISLQLLVTNIYEE